MLQTILNYAGLLLGLLSIAATVYFAVRYAERKAPRAQLITDRKIAVSERAPQDIQILYKGTKVDRLSSTTLWFWNSGKRPIRGDDIPPTQPLTVVLRDPEGPLQVLDVATRKVSRPAIDFNARHTGGSNVELAFSFLDYADGACIEIQHTGSRRTTATIAGVILGAPQGVRIVEGGGLPLFLLGPFAARSRLRRRSIVGQLLGAALFILVFCGMAYFAFSSRGDITITVQGIRQALAAHLSGQALDVAVRAVEASAKFAFVNRVGAYVMSAVFLLNAIAGVFLLLKRPYAFPTALLPDEQRESPPARGDRKRRSEAAV